MKITLALLLLMAGFSSAASTQISDTLYNPDGQLASGYLQISWPLFVDANGRQNPGGRVVSRVVNGAISVSLDPLDTAVKPNCFLPFCRPVYSVEYVLDGTIPYRDFWLVSTSTTPLSLTQVQSNIPAWPPATQIPYTATVISSTTFIIPQVLHRQGMLAIAACFTNSNPALAVECSWTRNALGDLQFSFLPAFSGTIEIGSASVDTTAPYILQVSGQTTVNIGAASHLQGPFAIPTCFDTSMNAVNCGYTRDSIGNLSLSFNPAYSGTIQVESWNQILPNPTSYSVNVAFQNSTSILESVHGQGTTPIAGCFSNAIPTLAVACAWSRDSLGDVNWAFSPPFSGLLQIRH